MPRVKTGVTAHRRHKKILKLAKGYKGSKSKQFKKANETVMKALYYACLLYTSPSPRDATLSRMPSSA